MTANAKTITVYYTSRKRKYATDHVIYRPYYFGITFNNSNPLRFPKALLYLCAQPHTCKE